MGKHVLPFRRYKPRNSNYYDDRVLDVLCTDKLYVSVRFYRSWRCKIGHTYRCMGVKWKRMGSYITAVDFPLSNATIEVVEKYPWADPEQYIDLNQLKERIKKLKKLEVIR
ncbi:MAG: hypothetical protein ACTSUC_08080 [Promethearchaeota archaeon]